MKLSILIPTYRRPRNVEQTVNSILVLLSEAPFDWEIVISNNLLLDKSEPAPLNLQPDSRIQILSPEKHLLSAEENFKFGLQFCRGEFVWLLGDDDVLIPAGIRHLIPEIAKGEFDLLIAGCKMITHDGQLLSEARQLSHELNFEIPFLHFVKRTGFWFVLAGFSTTIFRRSQFDLNLFQELMSISKIYSHASTLVGSFHNKRFKFFNFSIVEYRQNQSDVIDTGHWKRAAVSQGVSSKHFWVKGFIGHLELLIQRGVFKHQFINEVIDLTINRRFRFIDHLISHFLEQVLLHIRFPSASASELLTIIQFLEKVVPEYYDLWIYLKEISQETNKAKSEELFRKATAWFTDRGVKTHHFLDHFQFAVSGRFNIASYDQQFIAYNRWNYKQISELLNYFDLKETKFYLLIADSMDELLGKIKLTESELEKLEAQQGKSHLDFYDEFNLEVLRNQAIFFKTMNRIILGPLKLAKRILKKIIKIFKRFL